MSFDRPHDDFDPRPRRRDRGDDDAGDYDDFYGDTTADARARVAVPAMILIIASLLALVGCLAVVVGIICLLYFAPPPGPNGPPVELLVGIYAGGGLLGVVYFAVQLVGAVRMKQLRSYPFAMTAAIMATSTLVCLGILSVFVMPFGIWALVVLCNADVKREFDQNRPRARADDDYT